MDMVSQLQIGRPTALMHWALKPQDMHEDKKEEDLQIMRAYAKFGASIEQCSRPKAQDRRFQGILAVIGEGMKNYAGISGRFFNGLGQSKVNIDAWRKLLDVCDIYVYAAPMT